MLLFIWKKVSLCNAIVLPGGCKIDETVITSIFNCLPKSLRIQIKKTLSRLSQVEIQGIFGAIIIVIKFNLILMENTGKYILQKLM